IWFGSVTKLPGRAPASLGTNSPPGGSKIVTLTMSPMPSVILHGGGRRTLDVLTLHPAFGAASYRTQRGCIKRASAAGGRAKTTPTAPPTAEPIALVSGHRPPPAAVEPRNLELARPRRPRAEPSPSRAQRP